MPNLVLLTESEHFKWTLHYRDILGFGGWVGASPQISKGFLLGGGGGIPPDPILYFYSEVAYGYTIN